MSRDKIIEKLKNTFPDCLQCTGPNANACVYAGQSSECPGCAVGIFFDPEDAKLIDNIVDQHELGGSVQDIYADDLIKDLIDKKYPFIPKHMNLFQACQFVHDAIEANEHYPRINDDYAIKIKDHMTGMTYLLPKSWKGRWRKFFQILDNDPNAFAQTVKAQ